MVACVCNSGAIFFPDAYLIAVDITLQTIPNLQQATQHILRINPKFLVGYWEKRSYVKDKALKEQMFDARRKAGLK